MSKPRLLDLFCGAGGAARGYQRAGFHVVGVDHWPQPRYAGDEFVQADALAAMDCLLTGRSLCEGFRYWPSDLDAIHASPPCQAFTAYRRRGAGVGDAYPNLIEATRTRLQATELPYVIENVPGAPLFDPVTLCGSSFGLDVRRHRLFECSFPVMVPPCHHGGQTPRFPSATNREGLRKTVEVGVWRIPLEVQRRAMGIDWMTREELSEAIPLAFTELIGLQLMQVVRAREAE